MNIEAMAQKAAYAAGIREKLIYGDNLGILTKFYALARAEALREAAGICERYRWYDEDRRHPDDSNLGCAAAILAAIDSPKEGG